LLVFEHPHAGVQLPKGGLEAGESEAEGAVRELHEETGLVGLEVTTRIGSMERVVGAGPDEAGPLERHIWEVFLLEAPADGPGEWWHSAWGSPEEDGLRFRCHWLPVDQALAGTLHPLFEPVVAMVHEHLAVNRPGSAAGGPP
jgi:putative (di)nucleoside polyphosphate hydrolase